MLSFPLTNEQFANKLKFVAQVFDLSENRQVSEQGNGEILISDLGPRLWHGSITVRTDEHDEQVQVHALAQSLRQGVGTFHIGDRMRRFPSADPDGSLLGGAAVTLSAPTPGSSTMTLSGLPDGYKLTPGDYLSFDYGEGRRALHQVVIGGQVGPESTISLSVVPAIRPGSQDGAAVNLVDATCKAIMVPGSFKAGTIGLGGITKGFSFNFRQSLR